MDASSLRITVANLSTTIADAALQGVIGAINQQLVKDFQPEWGGTSSVAGVTSTLAQLPALDAETEAVIYLGASSDDPTTNVGSVLGYHFINQAEVPYGFVYLDVCQLQNDDWHVTLSHEVLELLGDPLRVE